MKKSNLFCIVSILVLTFICIYQSIKKEDVYISFTDLKGYNYQFIDSTDILKTSKIVIKGNGERSYEWWEIDIDSKHITKSDLNLYRKLVVNSQYLVINNYGIIKDYEKTLSKYRFHILKWENKNLYILPVKRIRYLVE